MNKALLSAVFCLAALPALAQTPQVGGNVNMPTGLTNGNFQNGVNSAISTGQIGSNSTATGGAGGGGGAGGQGGTGYGSANSSGGVASNSNTFNSNSPSTIRNTPGIALGMATAYCQNSAGVGGSGPGFSFSAMFGRHDEDCIRYNYALALQVLGEPEAALLVMAKNREVNEALTESRNRRNAQAAQPVTITRVVPMHPATARDPRPSRTQCNAIRRVADPTQVQRDYLAANCD
jgi:hypothetical protein